MKRLVCRFCLTAIVVLVVAAPGTSAWGDTQTITAPYSSHSTSTECVPPCVATADSQTGEMQATAVGWGSASATVVATHALASEASQVNYTVNVHIDDAALAVDGSLSVVATARHSTCESCRGFGAITDVDALGGRLSTFSPGDYTATFSVKHFEGSSSVIAGEVPPGIIDVAVELRVSAYGGRAGLCRFDLPCVVAPTPAYASGAATLTSIVAVPDPEATPTPTSSPTPTATPMPAGMHVHDLDGSATDLREGSWVGTVRIHVTDQDESPVAGVVVNGTWSSGSASGSCTTNDSGWCEVTSSTFRKSDVKSVTYSVDGVSAPSPYNSSANHDADGDSDGTTITVNKQN